MQGNHLVIFRTVRGWSLHTTLDWLDNWELLIHQDNRKLYHQTSYHTWEAHLQWIHSHHAYDINGVIFTRALVGEYRRVIISLLAGKIVARNSSPRVTTNSEEGCHIVLEDIIMDNPKLDWFITYTSCSDTTSKFREDIILGKALDVSDGS